MKGEELYTSQSIYQKIKDSPIVFHGLESREPWIVEGREYASESMITKIVFEIGLFDKESNKAAQEIHAYLNSRYSKANIQYRRREEPFYSIRNYKKGYYEDFIEPIAVKIDIEEGGIPASFLSRYKRHILYVDLELHSVRRSIGQFGRSIGHRFFKMDRIFPFDERCYYADSNMTTRLWDELFAIKTNKNIKQKAGLAKFDD